MYKTKTYHIWIGMKARCLNKNSTGYKNWGGRGIIICNRWLGKDGFINFYKDMGKRPENKTLDRKNNNKGYYKGNCRWITQKEQMNNTRINYFLTYSGKTKTVSQWAEKLKINKSTLFSRLRRNWTTKRALNF